MHRIALLLGILVAPGALVALGHRLRRRSTHIKRLFWGGVIGHTLGMLTALAAMILPPVVWASDPGIRTLLVHWSMLVGFLAGMALAPLLWRSSTDRPR